MVKKSIFSKTLIYLLINIWSASKSPFLGFSIEAHYYSNKNNDNTAFGTLCLWIDISDCRFIGD